MKMSTNMLLTLMVIGVGIVLMIGGIITATHGATVIGIIVAGVAAQRFISLRRKLSGNPQ